MKALLMALLVTGLIGSTSHAAEQAKMPKAKKAHAEHMVKAKAKKHKKSSAKKVK